MSVPVHPLLRMYVPRSRKLYLCCERWQLADAWAHIHGLSKEDWEWIGLVDLKKIKLRKGTYIVMIGDISRKLVSDIKDRGCKPITGEGFCY